MTGAAGYGILRRTAARARGGPVLSKLSVSPTWGVTALHGVRTTSKLVHVRCVHRPRGCPGKRPIRFRLRRCCFCVLATGAPPTAGGVRTPCTRGPEDVLGPGVSTPARARAPPRCGACLPWKACTCHVIKVSCPCGAHVNMCQCWGAGHARNTAGCSAMRQGICLSGSLTHLPCTVRKATPPGLHAPVLDGASAPSSRGALVSLWAQGRAHATRRWRGAPGLRAPFKRLFSHAHSGAPWYLLTYAHPSAGLQAHQERGGGPGTR